MKTLIILFIFTILPLSAYCQENPVNEYQSGCPHFHQKESLKLLHKFLTKNGPNNKFKKIRKKFHINNLSISAAVLMTKKNQSVCKQIHRQLAKNKQLTKMKMASNKNRWTNYNEATYFKLKNFYFVVYPASALVTKQTLHGKPVTAIIGPAKMIIIYNNKFKKIAQVRTGNIQM